MRAIRRIPLPFLTMDVDEIRSEEYPPGGLMPPLPGLPASERDPAMHDHVRQAIEARCWFRFVPDPTGTGIRLEGPGAPVTFVFAHPLTPAQLRALLAEVFTADAETGALRLWGNPIWLNDRQAHIYGLELDSWGQVYSDWSLWRVTLLLPWGTPADLVEYLHARLQQFDPAGTLYIGGQPYEELLAQLAPPLVFPTAHPGDPGCPH